MSKITVDMLEEIGEYEANISKFKRMFGGKEMQINSKNIIKASRKGFDMEWIASHFVHLFNKDVSLTLPGIAFLYAKENGPDDETRKVACQEPIYALLYAREVDGCVREDTFEAASVDWVAKYGYESFQQRCNEQDV